MAFNMVIETEYSLTAWEKIACSNGYQYEARFKGIHKYIAEIFLYWIHKELYRKVKPWSDIGNMIGFQLCNIDVPSLMLQKKSAQLLLDYDTWNAAYLWQFYWGSEWYNNNLCVWERLLHAVHLPPKNVYEALIGHLVIGINTVH